MGVREIVGVVKDFQNSSLHHGKMPLVINNYPEFNLLTVRIAPGRVAKALEHLEQTWKEFLPDKPFKFFFLSDDFANFYAKEITVQRGLSLTAILSIFTACPGS